MKKRFISCIVSSLIVASMLSGCGKKDETTTAQSNETSSESNQAGGTTKEEAINASVYGEVTSISDTEITIKKGTLNENSTSSDAITVTDEEATYPLASNVEVSMSRKGFGGGGGSSDRPSNMPSDMPSDIPSDMPSNMPSDMPSDMPSNMPSDMPSNMPSDMPGNMPGGSSSGDDSSTDENSNKPSMDFGGGGFSGQLSLDMISSGVQVGLELDEAGNVTKIQIVGGFGKGGFNGGGPNGGGPNGGGTQASDITYTAVNEISEDTTYSADTISSTGKDENAVLNKGYSLSMDGTKVERNSADSTGGDNSSFYGVGAAVLTTSGTTTIKNATITTDAKGGAGVFSYGSGEVYVSDSTINTTSDTSGGIHAAGGGKLYAYDLDITTNGESSAAIRSDRGGGTMVVDGGTYTSNGKGSPAVYSTADITINNSTLTATGSEAVCLEGLNTIRLYDTTLSGNMPEDSRNDCTWNVILYQSMSGDAEDGNGTFTMSGGKLIANNGGMFYTTNTESTFTIQDVDITYSEDSPFFLKCTGNSNERGWGSAGANGADCKFTAISQDMSGKIIYDSISSLEFYMIGGSVLNGAFIDDESNAGNGGDKTANVYIDSSSKWIVTEDSVVSKLSSAGTIVDADGNKVSIVGTDGTTYVEGTSSLKITVSEYSTEVDVKNAGTISSYSNYQVDKK